MEIVQKPGGQKKKVLTGERVVSALSLLTFNRCNVNTGETHYLLVSTPAFQASTCHQCKGAGSSLSWGLNFLVLVCGIF